MHGYNCKCKSCGNKLKPKNPYKSDGGFFSGKINETVTGVKLKKKK